MCKRRLVAAAQSFWPDVAGKINYWAPKKLICSANFRGGEGRGEGGGRLMVGLMMWCLSSLPNWHINVCFFKERSKVEALDVVFDVVLCNVCFIKPLLKLFSYFCGPGNPVFPNLFLPLPQLWPPSWWRVCSAAAAASCRRRGRRRRRRRRRTGEGRRERRSSGEEEAEAGATEEEEEEERST